MKKNTPRTKENLQALARGQQAALDELVRRKKRAGMTSETIKGLRVFRTIARDLAETIREINGKE